MRVTRRGLASVVFAAAAMLMWSACVAAVWSPVTAPGAYDFGTLDAGAGATKTVTFTLTNTDKRATAAMTAAVQGSLAFTITADTCSGRSLPPRRTCQVTVEYAPTSSGQSDSATLAATGPQIDTTIALSGESGTPDLAWSPASYDFGTVDAAATPPTHRFVLTNSGTGTSDILTASLSGSASMTLNDDSCTGTRLAPGASCSVAVEYAPTGSSSDSAVLSAGDADANISGTGQVAPLQITGINVTESGDTSGGEDMALGGQTVTVVEGSQDNIFTAELANVPAAGVTYQWTVTTPNSANYIVEPDQTESSLLIREDGIPNFAIETINLTLTVTAKDASSPPVTVVARMKYQNSALTLMMDTTCHTGGPKVTPEASATSIPLDGSLTISQTIVQHLAPGCNIGLPFEGTVTISSDGQVIDTFAGGPDVGDGTSPPPVGPFVIPGSALSTGAHTVTVSYAIWNGPAWAPFSFDFPVTVTP